MPDLTVYDEITVAEYVNVFDEGDAGWNITVYDEIAIVEWAFSDDYTTIALSVYEIITVQQARVARIDAPFNEFLRGLPFTESTLTNIMIAEFESGVEQRRDKWGRTKKRFQINFPVMTKAEVEAIRDFYVSKNGSLDTFQFTNPIDGITRTVRFEDDSFDIDRRYSSAFFASVNVIEVF